jgi:hypothetical protein
MWEVWKGHSVQTDEAQLSHLDSSALISPHNTNIKVLKKKYSEVTIEISYKGQK